MSTQGQVKDQEQNKGQVKDQEQNKGQVKDQVSGSKRLLKWKTPGHDPDDSFVYFELIEGTPLQELAVKYLDHILDRQKKTISADNFEVTVAAFKAIHSGKVLPKDQRLTVDLYNVSDYIMFALGNTMLFPAQLKV